MSDIQSQIRAKITTFTTDLEALVRRAAIDAVGAALGTAAPKGRPAGSGGKAKRGRPVGSGAKAAVAAAPAKPKGRGGKRVRRSPEAMADAADKILKHIKVHAGQRSEQIRSALSIPKNVWVPAIKTLLDGKKVTSKGVKRATTYAAK